MSEEEELSKEEQISDLEKKLEIAKLELKLRELKGEVSAISTEENISVANEEETQSKQIAVESGTSSDNNFQPSMSKNANAEDFGPGRSDDFSISSSLENEDSSFAETREPMYEMLSESWKEDEQPGEGIGGGLLGTALKIGLGIVTLSVFSQIPVGQDDYTKYSAVRGNSQKIDLGDLNDLRENTNGL